MKVAIKPPGDLPNSPRSRRSGGSSEAPGSGWLRHRPEHAGLFEAVADDSFVGRFNDAGADEQVLVTELGDSLCGPHWWRSSRLGCGSS